MPRYHDLYDLHRAIDACEEALDRATDTGYRHARMRWDRLVLMIDAGGFLEEVEYIEALRVNRIAHAMHYGDADPIPDTIVAFVAYIRDGYLAAGG